MQEVILNSLQEYYRLHKTTPRYLVLSKDVRERFEKEFKGASLPCIAFGLVVVEDIRAGENFAELVGA